MPIPTVIFCHGRESGPWGVKIRRLAKVAEGYGCRVVSRDDSDTRDPELRVARLLEEAARVDGPLLLAGSSMGGYVAAVAAARLSPRGLFLMAPALGLPGYAIPAPRPACGELCVVHGWGDELIPADSVLAFARELGGFLHLVPAGHALLEQLDWLDELFGGFLARCLQAEQAAPAARLLATF